MNPSFRRANLDPVDDIVPYFARSVSAIIGLWSFYGDFWGLPLWKFAKMLSVPANSVFWPQPVSFLEFLGRFPFSVLSSPFATVGVFQPTCHSRGMDGGQGQQLVVLVRFLVGSMAFLRLLAMRGTLREHFSCSGIAFST
jgi:hypothetical protein